MEPVDEAREGADETAAPTVAELEAYIQDLKRYIEMLEAENRSLRADVRELQRRELLMVLQRQ